MSDKVDAAIAGAAAPKPVELVQFPLRVLPAGRPVIIALPQDITDEETCHLLGLIVEITNQLRQQRTAKGIWTPPGSEVRPS